MQPRWISPPLAAALVWTFLCLAAVGCQQSGAVGSNVAPITTLQNQPANAAAPNLSALNPFALGGRGGARVAPPATGSYGNPGGVIATPQYAPQSYAPIGTTSNNWSPSASPSAGGVVPAGYVGNQTRPSSANETLGGGPPVDGNQFDPNRFGGPRDQLGVPAAGWRETGSRAPGGAGMPAPPAQDPWRAGGMGVIDLTGAPPPPGYVASGSPAAASRGTPTLNHYPATSHPPAGSLQPSPAPLLRPIQPAAPIQPGTQGQPAAQASGWTSVPPSQVRGF